MAANPQIPDDDRLQENPYEESVREVEGRRQFPWAWVAIVAALILVGVIAWFI